MEFKALITVILIVSSILIVFFLRLKCHEKQFSESSGVENYNVAIETHKAKNKYRKSKIESAKAGSVRAAKDYDEHK